MLCEWRCGVDRTAGGRGPCRLGTETREFRRYLSVTEEAEVVPALRVYWGGCNLRCGFCDTAPACFHPRAGRRVEPGPYAHELLAAVRQGARTISVLGGEPTLHAHTLATLADSAPAPLPLVLNTNLYMTPPVLKLLAGVIHLYLADLKFGHDECARRLASVPHYVAAARRNLKWIARQTPVIVRHLLLPGHLDCCFRPTVAWLAAELPGVRFRLYTGFVPCWQAGAAGVGRLNARDEVRAATDDLAGRELDWSVA